MLSLILLSSWLPQVLRKESQGILPFVTRSMFSPVFMQLITESVRRQSERKRLTKLHKYLQTSLEFNYLHDTESCIAENALKIPADDATQVNFPESSCFVFQIWSVPSSSTFDLPNGSSLFSLAHVTFGLGSPLAWQETETLRCLSTSRSEGGRTLNLGSCTTLRCVTAEACPNWFDAIHL